MILCHLTGVHLIYVCDTERACFMRTMYSLQTIQEAHVSQTGRATISVV